MHWSKEKNVLDVTVFEKYSNTSRYSYPVDLGVLHRATYAKDGEHPPIPPPYSEYTGLDLAQAFWTFVLLVNAYSLVIFSLKMKMSQPFREARWPSKLRHIVESLNIPDNFEDWDIGGLNIADYKKQYATVMKEIMSAIGLHLVSNLILLIPLAFTSK